MRGFFKYLGVGFLGLVAGCGSVRNPEVEAKPRTIVVSSEIFTCNYFRDFDGNGRIEEEKREYREIKDVFTSDEAKV